MFKKKLVLLMAFAWLATLRTQAQISPAVLYSLMPTYTACGGVIIDTTSSLARPAGCAPSSIAYQTKYSQQSFYVPHTPSTDNPVITLKLTFHIFNNADSTGIWPNDLGSIAVTLAKLDTLIDWLESPINGGGFPRYSGPRIANYSVPGFSPLYISDSRFKFEVTNIYFYNDDYLANLNTLYPYNPGPIYTAINAADPARLVEGVPIIFGSTTLGAPGNLASGYMSIFPNGLPFVQTTAGASPFSWFHQNHLRHEIGHVVGWLHTYSGTMDYDCNHPDFLSDVFPVNNPNCPTGSYPCNVCAEQGGLQSNNVMAGQLDNDWISPLQMGRRIRSMHLNPVRIFAKDMISDHQHPWLITSDELWDFDIQMYRDIVVKAPATLTINCKVAMAMEGKIIVEKGARLIIDGGEVTGWCKTAMWRGIEVEGTYGVGQMIYYPTGLAADFGIAKVINGGTISQANYGINNFRSDNSGNPLWGNQGGIIQCENANFIDNLRDVQFIPYQNLFGNDLSKFTRCNFKINNAINSVFPPAARVSLWEAWGVSFNGCNFEYNAGNAYTPGNRGAGIYSQNAKYYVDKACSTNAIPCSTFVNSIFKNLDAGVRVENTNPMYAVTVKNSDFYDNSAYGIYMNIVNTPIIENNYIETAGAGNAVGIYMNNCKYYNIKNNTLRQDHSTSPIDVGAYINNSQEGAHKFYRNTLSNFMMALSPLHNNSGVTNYIDGLLINCNDFTPQANEYDIAMLGVEPTVMLTQGAWVTDPFKLVRNKYAAYPCANENKWHIVNNSVKFVYHGSNSDAMCQPNLPAGYCADPAVLIANSGVPLNYTLHCQANPETEGSGNGGGISGINIALANAKAITSTLVPTYHAAIDGGSTQALLDSMNYSMVSSTSLRNLLNSHSPYLSDKVLLAYLRKPGVSPSNLETVIIANSPVSAAVKTIVDSVPLPFLVRSNVNAAQTGVSSRTDLEQRFSQAVFNLQAVCAEKLNYFLTDTIPASQDSVIHLLQTNEGNMLDADVQLIYAYMLKGDSAAAQTAISGLSTTKVNWATLLNNFQYIQYGPKRGARILSDSVLAAAFETHAGTSGISGQGAAQALLKFMLNQNYYIPHLFPGGPSSRDNEQENNSTVKNKPIFDRVSVYPNPTQNGITVFYESDEAIKLKAEVTDLTGRLIFSGIVNSNFAQELNLTHYSAGVYILTISKEGQVLYNTKLVKQD